MAQGAFLGFGAPLGWMAINWAVYHTTPLAFVLNNTGLFLYMLLGTVFVFALFGYNLGLSEDKLKFYSFFDPLTQLANRRYFMSRLENHLDIAKSRDKGFSLFYVDIDNFKKVNDSYGHLVGDEVLKGVGKAMVQVFRDEDVAGRVGGEEFAIIVTSDIQANVTKIAERLLQAIRLMQIDIPNSNGKVVQITASIGIAFYNKQMNSAEFIHQSDKALYQAKKEGKDRYCIFN